MYQSNVWFILYFNNVKSASHHLVLLGLDLLLLTGDWVNNWWLSEDDEALKKNISKILNFEIYNYLRQFLFFSKMGAL